MTWNLWLDDNANNEHRPECHPAPGREWKVALTSKQAMRLVVEHGVPAHMDLDFLLGEPDDRMGIDNAKFFIEWLVYRYPKDGKSVTWRTHSSDPSCNRLMNSMLERWRDVGLVPSNRRHDWRADGTEECRHCGVSMDEVSRDSECSARGRK